MPFVFASKLADFGQTLMILSLATVFIAFWFALLGFFRKDQRFINSARRASYSFSFLLLSAYMTLLYGFFTHDFSISYIARYSARTMPNFYLFCAGWGGQDGSMLFWTMMMGVLSVIAIRQIRPRYPDIYPAFLVTISTVQIFFFVITFFAADPFAVLSVIPADGKGLNPLLQTPVMAIHPPTLYMGLLTFYIPYAIGMAALLSGKLDNRWIKATRTWSLVAWAFLTLGNMLGGYWAYLELGWGGFWAWDPVENASFLPWLTATAFLHSAIVQERQNMLKVWNMSLLILTFFLTVFGTFLTRSGLISSVHAFARSDIGAYFVVFLVVIVVVSFGLMIWRLKDLKSPHVLESPISREASFVLNNALFSLATFIVFFGTTYPLWREWLTGTKATVGPPFFNRAMAPVAMLLLTLLGVIPLIKWRRTNPQKFIKLLVLPIFWGVVGGVGFGLSFSYFGPGEPDMFTRLVTSGLIGLCVMSIVSIWVDLREEALKRAVRDKIGRFKASLIQISRQRRQYSGYLVHIGVVFVFTGIAGYGFRLESSAAMAKGELADVGRYIVKFEGMKHRSDKQKTMNEGHLILYNSEISKKQKLIENKPVMIKSEGKEYSLTLKRIDSAVSAIQAATVFFQEKGKAAQELPPQQSISLKNKVLRLRSLKWEGSGKSRQLSAVLQILSPTDKIQKMVPAKYKYKKSSQPTTEVALRIGIFDDFYAILVTWEKRNKGPTLAHFKFYLNPLVVWIWIGALTMFLGAFIALLPRRRKRKKK